MHVYYDFVKQITHELQLKKLKQLQKHQLAKLGIHVTIFGAVKNCSRNSERT